MALQICLIPPDPRRCRCGHTVAGAVPSGPPLLASGSPGSARSPPGYQPASERDSLSSPPGLRRSLERDRQRATLPSSLMPLQSHSVDRPKNAERCTELAHRTRTPRPETCAMPSFSGLTRRTGEPINADSSTPRAVPWLVTRANSETRRPPPGPLSRAAYLPVESWLAAFQSTNSPRGSVRALGIRLLRTTEYKPKATYTPTTLAPSTLLISSS